MNAFANWLFTLLLGWTGGLANRAWNAVVNSAGGISDFFSRYWLILVLGLVIGGTVMDYGVWLLRWRPHRLWRSWLIRRRRRRDLQLAEQSMAGPDFDEHTRDTLADWIATPEEQLPVYDLSEDQPLAEPGYRFSQGHQGPFFTPVQPEDRAPDSPYTYTYTQQPTQASPSTPPEPEPLPFDPYAIPQHPAYQDMPYGEATGDDVSLEPQLAQNPGAGRRRRTERRQRTVAQRLADLRERLGHADEEEGMLEGLPAPIRQEDAFHEAVYPINYQPSHQHAQPEYGDEQPGSGGQ